MGSTRPVTRREYKVPDGVRLMPTADARRRITYATGAFIHVIGLERAYLMDQPHNLVRHPDMPHEVFVASTTPRTRTRRCCSKALQPLPH